MRIASSEIQLSTQHTLVEEHTRREELTAGVSSNGAWEPGTLQDGTARTRQQGINSSQPSNSTPTLLDEYLDGRSLDSLPTQTGAQPGEQSAAAAIPLPDLGILKQGLFAALGSSSQRSDLLSRIFQSSDADTGGAVAPLDAELSHMDRINMQLIQAAMKAFSGHALQIFAPADLDLTRTTETASALAPLSRAPLSATPHKADTPKAPEDSGPTFGLRYQSRETHFERETTTFKAAGVVHTADGEEISIDVSLTMGRQFASEENREVAIGGALQDPLVINFEGTAAELTERTYEFDLDADGGAEEQIHFIGPNSGFLALDRDGSGSIDNGSELFGATTGNGFAELAAYDEDGNQFIDEGDSIFKELRIWQKDSAGNDHLVALGQKGVGAIYLGHIDTPFQVKDEANQLQGVVRSSGVYLKEGGGTGTVQQLDLVV
jgi:hypothetical protein